MAGMRQETAIDGFRLAYERTGSLLVPIGMHAIFNLTSLVVIYGQAQFNAGK